ncbi:MAG: thiamine pyrophosphate-dependent enzyme [Eggerthellaceae bacterium]|nr:thiamine pyrophosphate-dependent enzyme [Eggerthellaceae bacterium]
MGKQLLMGNEAFAHAALEAGVNVVAGYPGTPSSELIETVAKLHEEGKASGVFVEWSTNEKAAMEVCAGAAISGAKCLFTCKQVGLNVASDPLMSLNYIGVKGAMVLFVADDPGPISSQTEQDTRRFGSFSKVPVLDPSTPEEGFEMMKAAFALSHRYGTPVIVRPTTRINHASTFFDVKDSTCATPIPEPAFEKDSRWVIFPKRSYEAHGEINERLKAIADDYAHDELFRKFNPGFDGGAEDEGLRMGIAAGGVSAAYSRESFNLLEKISRENSFSMQSYGFLQFVNPYPFPEQVADEFLEACDEVIVFEELDNVIEDELWKTEGFRASEGRHPALIYGKISGDARDRGENSSEDIAQRLGRMFDRRNSRAGIEGPSFEDALNKLFAPTIENDYNGPVPMRPPVLCAGCPHRGSFYAVKNALKGQKAVLCGDIGCYTLGNAKPLDAVDTCLCMGAGLTMAQGISIVDPEEKAVAFIGDSTFFASGLTGAANAAYNDHDVTFVILDNSTTAMTGSQPHPGTGKTLMGTQSDPLSIEDALHALGVKLVTKANPLKIDEAKEAAEEALNHEGPSAVIFKSPCIQLISPGIPVQVDGNLCTGCRRCITEIGCPAIAFDRNAKGPRSKERGQAVINDVLCVGCDLCVEICPFGAIGKAASSSGDEKAPASLEVCEYV